MFRRLREWIREPHNGLAEQDRQQAEAQVNQSLESIQVQLRSGGAPPSRVSDTEVVRFAAEATFSEATEAGEVVALWRKLSGDAHALGWSALTRASTQRSPVGRDPRFRQPMSEVTVQGDLAEFVDAYYAAYRILKNGWGLFDRRCTA